MLNVECWGLLLYFFLNLTTNMSSILLQFPPAPRRSNLTVMEQDGQMKDAPESVAFSCVPDYPEIFVSTETSSRVSPSCENAQSAFLSHGQTVWKRALYSWYRAGFVGSLEELMESKDEVPVWLSSVCQSVLSALQKAILVRESLFPNVGLSREDMLKKYTKVSNWSKSPVQALAWHPHVTKLALALKDDSVHVYSAATTLNPILKHKLQKQVADLAWQPLSGSVLAVACESCVLIWHVEPTSLAVRPSSSTVQILEWPGHAPVTSLAWDPHGGHLVSASPRHTSVLVWDVPTETAIPLSRNRGGGVAHLSYSPDGAKLLTATTSALFRVWETHQWHWEVWSQLSGPLSAACWSPDGRVLLFAMEGETGLYAIRYSEDRLSRSGVMSAAGTSVLLADVTQVGVSAEARENTWAGGAVRSIVWDKTGERVAVMFQPDELGNNCLVAVFKATLHPVLELLPSGFVKGKTGESAHHIAFQPSFPDGALLSVVWSSGRVGYIPMLFTPIHSLHTRQSYSFRPLNSSMLKSPQAL